MKTTLMIDDSVMHLLRRRAAAERTTISALVESALRRLLDEERAVVAELPPLPAFNSGGALVDVADREALYRAMEDEDAKER